MLKGGLTVNASGPAELHFESENTSVEIWVDSVSLQPFTKEEWRTHQTKSIEKARKKTVRFRAVDAQGTSLAGATVSLAQKRPGFPFGCAIPGSIVNNTQYQNWFASRFTVTVFENEMKWYSTERAPGQEDYSVPDAMVAFAKQHNITIRGHNVFWDDPKYQMDWVRALDYDQLWNASNRRINSVMSRYRGQLIAWDVVNEDLHFSSFEDRLGKNASNIFHQKAHSLGSNTLMFLNDYNTLEQPGDPTSTPGKYLEKLREVKSYPGNDYNMAIGLEGHFSAPNIPYMRSALDVLAGAKVPIWLTEVDVTQDPNHANYLEEILREAYSHPAVNGIVLWAGWHPESCNRMCLTDNNFNNHPTGDVVDKLIAEWRSGNVTGKTDADGFFETQLFHGEYEMSISDPTANSSSVQSLKVESGSPHGAVIRVQV
ncbi:endo-1,4-beta-xylanase 5-like [Phoenix dactylifera]|uniref:Endo-1,4-beta-xylanase 5-like n=1 Tax=Phoenix dactylifera TaxID=42345 RepID=A0A8B8ZNB5_PHODC|nr:endo-1,4-beta-xylanase 5-like [Phoenix dactylifera]